MDAIDFAARVFNPFTPLRTPVLSRLLDLDLVDDHFDRPREAGWQLIVHREDWEIFSHALGEEISALCGLRTGKPDQEPLFYDSAAHTPQAWETWLERHYEPLRSLDARPPYYLLLLGSPDRIPFGFQALLQSFAAVGRVCFDSMEDYRAYFRKVLAAESFRRTALPGLGLFAPCHDETTAITFRDFACPLEQWARAKGFRTRTLIDSPGAPKSATKRHLEGMLVRETGLLLSLGHGYCQDRGNPMALNGAICCPAEDGSSLDEARDLVAARDLARLEACLEGGIYYQYGCFGYGTPELSTVDHWRAGRTTRVAETAFVSALPKRLLAHPKGALGYIGHVDVALVFESEDEGRTIDPLKPVQWTLESLLGHGRTLGYSLQGMRHQMLRLGDRVAFALDALEQGRRSGIAGYLAHLDPQRKRDFLESMVRLIDARNFMVLGDPAIRLGTLP